MNEEEVYKEYIVSTEFLAKHKREYYDIKGDEVIFSSSPFVTFSDIYNEAPINNMPHWININDSLPENDNRVLVCLNEKGTIMCNGSIDTDRYLHKGWVRWNGFITHWMPLPDVPKEENCAIN